MSKKIRVALHIVILSVLIGFGAMPQTAFAAGISYQNCPPGYSLTDYINNSCAFQGSWDMGGRQWLYLNVYVDPSIPADVSGYITQGINSWTNSSADVVLTQVYSSSSANISIWQSGSYDTDANCFGTWGYTNSPNIWLNSYYWDSSHRSNGNCNISGWLTVSAHELGHAMGLDHNNYWNGSLHQLMNPCAGYSCSYRATAPQDADIAIFNAKYPRYTSGCLHCYIPTPQNGATNIKPQPGPDTQKLAAPKTPYPHTATA